MFPFRVLLAALLTLAAPALAANSELEKAEKAFEQLKYTEADKALQKALTTSNNSRATVLRIFELQGIIDATVGKKTALDNFRKLVALDPDRVLSRDFGPRILSPFYEAKARLDENPPLKLKTSSVSVDGQQKLMAAAESDQLKMATKIVLFWRLPDASWNSKVEAIKPSGSEQLVTGDRVEWYARLMGAYDATLLEVGSATAPLIAEPPRPTPEAVTLSPTGEVVAPIARPMSTRRKLALGTAAVGVAALIGSGGAAISSRSAWSQVQNPQRDQSGRLIGVTAEGAHALESQAVNSAIAANVLLGVGLVAVGGGIFLWFGDRDSSVALVPSPGGAAFVGTFP